MILTFFFFSTNSQRRRTSLDALPLSYRRLVLGVNKYQLKLQFAIPINEQRDVGATGHSKHFKI